MSNVDAEDLNARLSQGLDPADRTAFRKAAETAVATSPECSGEGSHTCVCRKPRPSVKSRRDRLSKRRVSFAADCYTCYKYKRALTATE